MEKFLILVFFGALSGLIAALISPLIYRTYFSNQRKWKRRSFIRMGAILIFSTLIWSSIYSLQNQNNTGLYSTPTDNGVEYVRKATPVYNTQYNFVRAINGNTVELDINGQITPVRLIGISTETNRPGKQAECLANTSTAKLTEYMQGKQIELEGDDELGAVDKNNVQIKYVTANDENINHKIIADGFAYQSSDDNSYKYRDVFKATQTEASNRGVGFWSNALCATVTVARASSPAGVSSNSADPQLSQPTPQPAASAGNAPPTSSQPSCSLNLLGLCLL